VPDRVARVADILGLPEHVLPLNMIAIGYPAEEPGAVDRYDASRVHYDAW
jgi:nitroreductase